MIPTGTRLLNAPTIVAATSTTARNSTALGSGIYEITSTVDCFLLQGASDVESTSLKNPFFAGERMVISVSGTDDDYIAVITGGATGAIYIKLIEAEA